MVRDSVVPHIDLKKKLRYVCLGVIPSAELFDPVTTLLTNPKGISSGSLKEQNSFAPSLIA